MHETEPIPATVEVTVELGRRVFDALARVAKAHRIGIAEFLASVLADAVEKEGSHDGLPID